MCDEGNEEIASKRSSLCGRGKHRGGQYEGSAAAALSETEVAAATAVLQK